MRLQRFQWDENLLTGIALIDAQHQEYFRRVNQALASAEEEIEAEFLEALQFVQVYALEHFDAEQHVMTFHEYPAYEGHLTQHQTFASRLDALAEAVASEGFRPDVGQRLNALLVEWFVRHIRTEDQKLGKYLLHRPGAGVA
jgi:hemerythrin-like metal-binding protein